MAIDPSEMRWLTERLDSLDAQLDRLLADEQQTNRHFLALHRRLQSVEKLKTGITGFILGLATCIGGAIYWGGSIANEVRHASEAHAAIKELAKEFHEHERRASTPKTEK